MKRRIISSLLILGMTASLFAACGKKPYSVELPTEMAEGQIFVKAIDNLSEDFIKGMDISSVISEEESGVKYYNEDGEEEDLFKILADSGINYIRVRVWNNPYDEDGNGYGGGNCDVAKAAEIGKRAADYGMKLLVDFHYSDFWADPNKQYVPVEWRGMSNDSKAQALYDFTVDSLEQIADKGADIGMVQIGNEINNGLSSEYNTEGIMQLLDSASKAVRAYSEDKKSDIKIAVHYTEIDDAKGTYQHAQDLVDYKIDYDIFGVSYYPYWHGSLQNMKEVLSTIKEEYGKETCVLETSYCYTAEDGDGFGNSVSAEDCLEEYPVSVQGQANCIRDIMAYANEAGALGLFYWEGAWIPVGSDSITNKPIWEEHGSGWASSYSASYDKKDAGQYYGGCSWDNQAFFDHQGNKLPSLDVFKYVNYGAKTDLQVLAYKEVVVESGVHKTLKMPETVEAIYNNPDESKGVTISWDQDQLASVDTDKCGEYPVSGETEDGTTITATVKITNMNYVKNSSFEDSDLSMYNINIIGGSDCVDRQTKAADAASGENALHFYSVAAQEFTVEQELEGLDQGQYTFTASMQGGDVGNSEIYIYVKVNDQLFKSEPVLLDGWVNWKNPMIEDIDLPANAKVTVGYYVKCAAKGWGTVDDLNFYSQE